MEKNANDLTWIFGVRVMNWSKEKILQFIQERVEAYKLGKLPLLIATVNPEFVMEAQNNHEFKLVLNSVDLPIADGAGLRYANSDIKNITPGRDLVKALITDYEYKIYYLGGRGGVAEKMANKYRRKNDKIDNWDEGFENISAQMDDRDINQKIVDKINKYKPDILLVAYGAPWQEVWMWQNREKLLAKVMIGVGGTFDYLTGQAKVPPRWVSRNGLEWLWRLVRQPWRWKRQLRLINYVWLCIRGN